jgi:hypothetical protein
MPHQIDQMGLAAKLRTERGLIKQDDTVFALFRPATFIGWPFIGWSFIKISAYIVLQELPFLLDLKHSTNIRTC